MQLVCNCVASSSEETLAQRLGLFFEKKCDLLYSNKDMLNMDDAIDQNFRLRDLGYASQATTNGPPRLHTCLSLCDSIFTDGFVTQGDPLMIWKKPSDNATCFLQDELYQGARASLHCSGNGLDCDGSFPRCSCIDSSWRRKPPRKSQGHPRAGCQLTKICWQWPSIMRSTHTGDR